MSSNAFRPNPGSASKVIAVTSTSTTTPVQVKDGIKNATERMFYNAGPNDCWMAWGASNVAAVIPTLADTAATGIAIPAGAVIVLGIPPDAYFAAICASGQTASLYITPGEGN